MSSALIYAPPGDQTSQQDRRVFFPEIALLREKFPWQRMKYQEWFFLGGPSNFWFVATLICGWREYFCTEKFPRNCLTGNWSLIGTYETLTIIVFNLATQDISVIQDQLVGVLNKKQKKIPTKPKKIKKNEKESNINVWTGKYVPLASYLQVEASVVLVFCFAPQDVLPDWKK